MTDIVPDNIYFAGGQGIGQESTILFGGQGIFPYGNGAAFGYFITLRS